jgi:coproporphyrinogen III oxidase-like Fe-S oxidoreductase
MPFCAARCDYCAFATWTDRHHLQHAYLDACRVDIERAVAAGLPHATSVFVGGGTPSLVDPQQLVAVLDAVPKTPDCEVTVECNPDTVTPELVEVYS